MRFGKSSNAAAPLGTPNNRKVGEHLRRRVRHWPESETGRSAAVSGKRSYQLFDDLAVLSEVLGDDQLTGRLFIGIESKDPKARGWSRRSSYPTERPQAPQKMFRELIRLPHPSQIAKSLW
jgi:hypothetical protein